MNLTPQHKQILKMLEDGQWHCPTVELYIKDDRKRISELIKGGYQILGDKLCDNPNHGHVSRVKLRRLVLSRYDEINTMADRQDKLLYEAEDRRRFTQFTGMTSQEFLLKYPSEPININQPLW